MSVDHSPVELPPGLLAEYRESARLQLQLVAELADRLAVAGNDPDALSRLHQETHKIHGSAGSYGFWPASRLAAGMEETVKDWVARPNDADMDRGSMKQWFVVQLAEALELEPPDPPAPLLPPLPLPLALPRTLPTLPTLLPSQREPGGHTGGHRGGGRPGARRAARVRAPLARLPVPDLSQRT